MDVKSFLDSLDPADYQALLGEVHRRGTARTHPQHVSVDIDMFSSGPAHVRISSSDGTWDFETTLHAEDTGTMKFNPLGLLERHGWRVCAMSQKLNPSGVAILLVRDVLEGEEGNCPGLEALRKELEDER